ncbi:tetratricopeptide repeat protein [Immundisolibacter cernigliae]|uniref:tetratricopeptide repeat protein n=1 Tax=Immundisolibacter cernigliae TaxID=1810504 RepID=UPI000A550DB2
MPQDYVQAVKWYRLAAEQGRAAAQRTLGFMYDKGQGVPQDYVQAVKWYRLAAEQGDAAAQNNLGTMYDYGRGVPQDYVQAHKWYSLAASQALTKSESHEQVVKNRDQAAARMTPAQIAEAKRLAREWTPKSEGLGQ